MALNPEENTSDVKFRNKPTTWWDSNVVFKILIIEFFQFLSAFHLVWKSIYWLRSICLCPTYAAITKLINVWEAEIMIKECNNVSVLNTGSP